MESLRFTTEHRSALEVYMKPMKPEEALLKLIRLDATIDGLRMEKVHIETVLSKLEREREIFVKEHADLFRPEEPSEGKSK